MPGIRKKSGRKGGGIIFAALKIEALIEALEVRALDAFIQRLGYSFQYKSGILNPEPLALK